MAFERLGSKEVAVWRGSPDSQAGHDAILAWVTELTEGTFLLAGEMKPAVVGNLGECISAWIGLRNDFKGFRMFAANATKPLNFTSNHEIDILWIFFGETEKDDLLVIQEVKATGQSTLGYAEDLVKDVKKLFGLPVRLTLPKRLNTIKAKFEFELQMPDLCPRIQAFSASSPAALTKVKLVPTLVHDINAGDGQKELLAVHSAVVSLGWSQECVTCWSVGLDDLDDRLIRIATGST